MKRWLLHLACLLSLLLAVAVSAGWAASAAGAMWPVSVVPPLEPVTVRGTRVFLGATPTSCGIYAVRPLEFDDRTPDYWATWKPRGPNASRHHEHDSLGFHWLHGDHAVFGINGIKWADHWIVLSMPNVVALPLLLAPPAAYWTRAFRRSRRRRRRRRLGLCA